MRNRQRICSGLAVATAAASATATVAVAVPAQAAAPERGAQTEVTFDRTVVAQLARWGVSVRAVDADQRGGRGDDLRVTFRVDRMARPGVIEHRGSLVLDSPRRPDVVLTRPTVDLDRHTVSFGLGRDRVTLLSVTDRTQERDRRGPDRDRADRTDRDVSLRLTREGEQTLDRAFGTTWFWTGQPIGTAEVHLSSR
ncbi:hypothetical protein [Cryptosporangium phraense]|uniref:Htaa domain-containing protein n=1 Tax=Cryptosporangium phraense TaxID=2593070 RepID=A0A545AZ11_9ACTN|nr:hypothetical protein [Cryptosporangium phraense]TQS46572.1 hypothetical protein FL583_04105 [Cryptosporangium phraense]